MREGRRLVAWSLWGVGPALYGLGTLAVIAAQPVAGQHAVVGAALLVAPIIGALGGWALRFLSPVGASLVAVASGAALLLASWLQRLLGEAWLYQGGHNGAPVLLVAAVQAAIVAVALQASWWTLALPVLLCVGYVAGSLAWPAGDTWWLVGGALASYGIWVSFTITGAFDGGRRGAATD